MAHHQPWTFVAPDDPGIKRDIRLAAEEEERRFYRDRELPEWHSALAPLETDEHKEFLEVAPWLVVAFAQKHTPNPMAFLTKVLDRPRTERPYILFPVGYPAADCEVPALTRKPLAEALIVRAAPRS